MAAATAAAPTAAATGAAKRRIRILMGGYGPPSTGFSLALKKIGDRLEAGFGDEVEVKYVYNILDLGYRGEDILWLVEQGRADARLSIQQLPDRTGPRPRSGRPAVPLFRRAAGPQRHGRAPRPAVDRQDRSGHELSDSRLFRKRLPPRFESPPADPYSRPT